ncbi:MAG TPA: ricin-type beta-trefoil lectin domain protein [Actinocrinis sp.]|nr:ricin-type beta-trefoil lectin domain protein [Actinocrinis sp.]
MNRSVIRRAAALGLAAAAGAAWATAPAQAAAVRTQAATPAITQQPVALRVEPLGDSITYGSHSSTGNGYRGPLFNALTGEGFKLDFVGPVLEGSMADSADEGHPGWRIDALQGLTNGSVAKYRPNVVLLMAGANDLIQNNNVSTAPSRLSALIDQVTTNDPGVTVLVGNLIQSLNANVAADGPTFNAALPAIIQSKQAAGQHVALVDMYDAIPTSDLISDGIHPNDTGYQLMANAWNTAIQTANSAGWFSAAANTGAAAAEVSGGVQSGIAGDCLDVNGGNSADGTAVQLWTCNHTTAQSWSLYNDDTLRSLGKCLDATAGATGNGTKIELYTCNGTGAQVWQPYNGGYLNLASGRCLDDPASSTNIGTQLQLYDCNSSTAQLWAAPGVGPAASGLAGKCLDVYDATNVNGTKADLYTCNGTVAQQWDLRSGMLQAVSLCLDIAGNGTADGTLVDVWDCNGTANQVWVAQANGSLLNPQSGKCLDDPGQSSTDGTQLEIWDCNGGANQVWKLP